MIAIPSSNEPNTKFDIQAMSKAVADLAQSMGYPTRKRGNQYLEIKTSADTFIAIERLKSGYFWGALGDYSTIQSGYISSPAGLPMLVTALLENSARSIESVLPE